MIFTFSPEIKEHIDAGHFDIYPMPWMNHTRIWFWKAGGVERGPFSTQNQCEAAALAWYNEQTPH